MVTETPEKHSSPKDYNRAAIKYIFREILAEDGKIDLDNPTYAPLPLTDGNYHAVLEYYQLAEHVMALRTKIITDTLEDVASTEYAFEDFGELTIVSSVTEVSPAHRQKGIGSGLVALTDDIIMYGVFLIPGARDTLVSAAMVDAAEGEGIYREGKIIGRLGWTGQQLAKLGYEFHGLRNRDNQPIWIKQYHTPQWQSI
ncbi:MAG: hypothetical protein HY430_03270 [Candidatus Levybacteria bacterium]|nr:hypothetical protein [Candidatus Levybacteria bacterium]